MSETLVFLEFREDAEYFVEAVARELKDDAFRIVALDDGVSMYLHDQGIAFMHAEELLPAAAEGRLCGDVWQRLEACCAYVDSTLTQRLDFLEKGAPYLAAQIEVLKIVFDALIVKIEILRSAFEQLRPRTIYFARNELVEPRHHRLFFDETFSLFSVLLETRLQDIAGYAPDSKSWLSRFDPGAAGTYQSTWWYRTARKLNHVATSLRQPAIDDTDGRDDTDGTFGRVACIVGGSERSLQIVVDSLRAEGTRCIIWRPQTAGVPAPFGSRMERMLRGIRNLSSYRRYRAELESAWRTMSGSAEFLAYFNWKGVDFFNIVCQRMHVALTANVAHQQASLDEAKGMLEKVDMLLSSYYSMFERPIAFLARRHGKSVISVQHGAMGHDDGGYGWQHQGDPLRPSNKGFFYTDMADVDVKLVWGEHTAREMARWRFNHSHPRLAVLGAPHLAHLKGSKGRGDPGKRILFVSNSFGNNTYMLMNFRGLGYRHRQYQILRSLASHSADHEILYKAYPSWVRNEAYSLVHARCQDKRMTYIGSERRLPELFKEVDCVVMDLPTTGFYEACMTALPVFLFNVACNFSDAVLAMIKQRVYYSEDLDEFCAMLDGFQHRPESFPALHDEAFIRAFSDVDRKVDITALISQAR